MSNVDIRWVKCLSPATGINSGTTALVSAMSAWAAGATAAAFATIGTVETGGAGSPSFGAVPGAFLAGGAAGAASVGFIDKIFSGQDDLYIEVDGVKVWPQAKYMAMESQHTEKVDVTTAFTGGKIKVELWEYDRFSGNDSLGYLEFLVPKDAARGYVKEDVWTFAHAGEGSVYEVGMRFKYE